MARDISKRSKPDKAAKAHQHKERDAVLRPGIGIQVQFKKKLPQEAYRYDRSLDPQLCWDINADPEHGESLIAQREQVGAISELFATGEHRQIAVKVTDDRSNELPGVGRPSHAE